MKITYNWLKKFVEFDLSPSELSKKLTMAGLETRILHTPTSEKEGEGGDYILEADLTPNRSDCHSIIGIAREVSTLTNGKFMSPEVSIKESGEDINNFIAVTIKNSDLCNRYTARFIKDVNVGQSPLWLREKLTAVGIRPVNNIVDATNYILWETGQPLHAFDYNCIKGNKIVVRKALKDESFVTLDGKKYKLTEDFLVIADTEKTVALAGIMGGENSAITLSTKDVLLESAYFNPANIRRTSRKLGIFTDSSYRFEKGVDPENVSAALNMAAALIVELANGKVVKGSIDHYPERILPLRVDLRISRTNKILGTSLSRDYIFNLLHRLMFFAEITDEDKIRVHVPSFRRDIEREVDIIEEVARLHNYENIPKTIPSSKISTAALTENQMFERDIRNILTSAGLTEVINYSFIDEKFFNIMNISEDDPLRNAIRLRNPLNQNWSHMRTTILPGILQTAIFNINRGTDDIGIFEIGRVFSPEGTGGQGIKGLSGKQTSNPPVIEKVMLGGAITERIDRKIWSKGERDFYCLKGIIEFLLNRIGIFNREFCPVNLPYIHPKKGASIKINGEEIGFLGELHTAVSESLDLKEKLYIFECSLDKIHANISIERKYKSLPRYPAIYRDIAIILDSVIKSEDVCRAIRNTDDSILKEIILFDYYEGNQIPAGKKSLAYSLIYRTDDRTLTDDDVNPLHEKIIKNLKDKLGAELR